MKPPDGFPIVDLSQVLTEPSDSLRMEFDASDMLSTVGEHTDCRYALCKT